MNLELSSVRSVLRPGKPPGDGESRGGQRGFLRPQWDITGKRDTRSTQAKPETPAELSPEMSRCSGDLDTL